MSGYPSQYLHREDAWWQHMQMNKPQPTEPGHTAFSQNGAHAIDHL
jgi:hypothetical protein